MIVNTFIITPKPEWRDASAYTRCDEAMRMAFILPEKYRNLFRYLIRDSLNDLMDIRNHRKAYDIAARAAFSGEEGTWFSHRGECLFHILRRTFYDTLLIIRNDYNPYSFDTSIVVLSQETMTEGEWETLVHWNREPPISTDKRNGKVFIGNFIRTA